MSGDRLRRGVWDSAYEYYGAHPCDGGWCFVYGRLRPAAWR